VVKRIRLKRRVGAEVGYGKPPKATQFKPGQSGNPRGRPKGSLNVATVLERTLREPLVVTEGGQRRVITKLEAAVKQLANKAASGDARAIQLLIGLTQAAEDRRGATPSSRETLPEADRQVMQNLLTRIQRYADEGKPDES
jgi:Family of unknown function (DUF5681)